MTEIEHAGEIVFTKNTIKKHLPTVNTFADVKSRKTVCRGDKGVEQPKEKTQVMISSRKTKKKNPTKNHRSFGVSKILANACAIAIKKQT